MPKETFKQDDANANQQQSFLFKLSNCSAEIDWEPLIKLIIKRCSKEQIYELLDQRYYEQTSLINLVKGKPNSNYRSNDKILDHENQIYLKHLDLMLELARHCDYDVGVQIKYNKQNVYNMGPNVTQEKVDSLFEHVNEEKLDNRVNGFGLFDIR